ncbi:MAG TPA: HlyD family efflux transporter periplasmic adaptor subunit [Opitutaceae bacterium]|nr:HlyD family efflux transporter periplasmic adaptor subunit [Opitutaceae bacterium]
MDIQRPDQSKVRRKKRILYGVVAAVVLAGITFVLGRLKPAAPTVERGSVWIDTVKRGPMVRQVRGLGTLVPEEIRWIAARTSGHVDRIVLRPGASVEPDSVILVLSNPEVEQAAVDAESQYKAAEAELVSLRVQLGRDVLAAESAATTAKAIFEQTKLRAEVNGELFKDGLVSSLEMRLSKVTAEHAQTANGIEQKRFAFAQESVVPQVSAKEAEVDRFRAAAKLRRDEVAALSVRAGVRGVLQLLPVQVGAQVQPGANLARVADPTRLKAEVLVAESQAKDILIGQLARIDTRNGESGIVEGKVARVDPSVQNGTVTVDITLNGELPKGARPDLSVDGVIELERLENVVFVGRPAFGQERSTVGIFRLDADGVYAIRTPVQLGRSSVNTIEIVQGLQPNDRVILSDMSQWETNDRIKLN